MNTQMAQVTLGKGHVEDDTRTCKICFNAMESGTAPTVCDFCGREACHWCACFTSPQLGACDNILSVSVQI